MRHCHFYWKTIIKLNLFENLLVFHVVLAIFTKQPGFFCFFLLSILIFSLVSFTQIFFLKRQISWIKDNYETKSCQEYKKKKCLVSQIQELFVSLYTMHWFLKKKKNSKLSKGDNLIASDPFLLFWDNCF